MSKPLRNVAFEAAFEPCLHCMVARQGTELALEQAVESKPESLKSWRLVKAVLSVPLDFAARILEVQIPESRQRCFGGASMYLLSSLHFDYTPVLRNLLECQHQWCKLPIKHMISYSILLSENHSTIFLNTGLCRSTETQIISFTFGIIKLLQKCVYMNLDQVECSYLLQKP